eukprot:7639300-Pyramimonas_sp.AAC.1
MSCVAMYSSGMLMLTSLVRRTAFPRNTSGCKVMTFTIFGVLGSPPGAFSSDRAPPFVRVPAGTTAASRPFSKRCGRLFLRFLLWSGKDSRVYRLEVLHFLRGRCAIAGTITPEAVSLNPNGATADAKPDFLASLRRASSVMLVLLKRHA